jgi:hypothetical protein
MFEVLEHVESGEWYIVMYGPTGLPALAEVTPRYGANVPRRQPPVASIVGDMIANPGAYVVVSDAELAHEHRLKRAGEIIRALEAVDEAGEGHPAYVEVEPGKWAPTYIEIEPGKWVPNRAVLERPE